MGQSGSQGQDEAMQHQLEQIQVMPIEQINAQANDLYIDGHQQLLLNVWETLDNAARCQYFDLTLCIIKYWLARGEYSRAEEIIRDCAHYYHSAGDSVQQARLQLQWAYLCYYSQNMDGVRRAIQRVRELNPPLNLLAECENLEAELVKGESPEAASRHYLRAIHYFQEYSQVNSRAGYDLARTYLQLADVSLVQGHVMSGKASLRKAQDYITASLQTSGVNSEMISWTYLKTGISYEILGDYKRAQAYYEEAETAVSHNRTRLAEVRWHKAHLAMLCGNDAAATRELARLDLAQTDNVTARVNGLLTEGYIHLFLNKPEDAARCAMEAEQNLADDHSLLSHRARMLKAAAAIVSHRACPALLDELQESIDFCSQSHHHVEASLAYLIFAWACVALNQVAQVQGALVQCIRHADHVQHVWHLARLYKLSLELLHGWWEMAPNYGTFLLKMAQVLEELPNEASQDHLYLRSMGKTQVMVGNRQVMSAGRGRNLELALLFYMVQRKRAKWRELAAVLWSMDEAIEAGEDQLRRRLNFLNANLKKKFGFQWMTYDPRTEFYTLDSERIAYHDAEAFEAVYQEATHTQDETARLLKFQRAINLYAGEYLKELAFEFIEDRRMGYCDIFASLIYDAITLAEALHRPDLVAVWKIQRAKFSAYASPNYDSAAD